MSYTEGALSRHQRHRLHQRAPYASSVQDTMGRSHPTAREWRCWFLLDCRNQHGDVLIPRDFSPYAYAATP